MMSCNTPTYDIHIPLDPLLCDELNIPSSPKTSYCMWNGVILNRITDISARPYDGCVFDLCIEDNHNYVTQSGLVHNSGRRKGSIAVYLEPWHADVLEFVELRRQTGAESNRARDLFLALWIPDLFMRKVIDDADWYLMSPDQCPGLADVYGKDFDTLYEEYVAKGLYVKKISAKSLWMGVLQSQVETGTPYIMFKDSVNTRCNQNNIGTIKSSNLCVAPETQILTNMGYRTISDLEDTNVDVWNGGEFSRVTIKKTGTDQPLLTVTFSNGESLDCTPYHKFYIRYGVTERIIDAKDLTSGMQIIEFDMPIVDDKFLREDFKYPYTHGLMSWTDDNCSIITLCEQQMQLLKHLDIPNIQLDIRLDGKLSIKLPVDIASKGIVPVDQKTAIKLRWLEGLVDGYGYGCTHTPGNLRITSIDHTFLVNVKRMLNTLGIDPNISNVHDVSGLSICALDLKRLVKLGFSPKLACLKDMETPINLTNGITVTSILNNGRRANTFCFNEPLAHAAVFNGIRTGNCSEITEYSDADTYAVCNLGSIAVNKFYNDVSGVYDHVALHNATCQLTRNLNRVIDINFYPTPETALSNRRMRPIGIGVQGFGDLYNMMKVPYESAQAIKIDADVMETIYHASVVTSIDIAKRDGAYEGFEGSMFSKGIFQFDMYDGVELSGLWDWDSVRCDIRKYGIRNSLLTALMPTASTSQILGNSECFEPIQSNVFKRTTLAGEFLVVNKYLMRSLLDTNAWSTTLRRELMENDGSVARIPNLPADITNVHKTVWEISQRYVIEHAAARAPFVDQSQSMNLFFAVPNYQKMHSALVYAWRKGLKTGCYYMRSKPAVEALKVASFEPPALYCTNNEGCIMCSA